MKLKDYGFNLRSINGKNVFSFGSPLSVYDMLQTHESFRGYFCEHDFPLTYNVLYADGRFRFNAKVIILQNKRDVRAEILEVLKENIEIRYEAERLRNSNL